MSPLPLVISTASTGYAAPLSLQLNDPDTRSPLARAAAQVLRDPILQQRLVDRVCDLLMEDVRLQKERN